jgi:hypothetical protein
MAGPAAAPRPGTTSDSASVRRARGGGGMRGSPGGRRGSDDDAARRTQPAAARRSHPAAAMDRLRGSGQEQVRKKFWAWRGNGADLARLLSFELLFMLVQWKFYVRLLSLPRQKPKPKPNK